MMRPRGVTCRRWVDVREDRRMSALEHALGIKSVATVEELIAATKDTGVAPIEQLGASEAFRVSGGFVAAGGGFDKI